MLAPIIIFILVMVLFPLLYTLFMSVHSWRMSAIAPPRFVGLDNFTANLKSGRFWNAVRNTMYYSSLSVMVEIVLGFLLAVFLHRKFLGKDIVKTLFLLPMVATPVAVSLVWRLMYEPTIGILNFILKMLNLPTTDWLTNEKTAMTALVVIDIWSNTPMVVLILLAGLVSLPTEPYESALVDGAGKWQRFWWITFPLMLPTLFVAILLRTIDAIKAFDIIFATTQGGPAFATETLNIYAYIIAFNYLRMGTSSSLVVMFMAIIAVISLILLNIRRKLSVT